jgi:hypothetical protein
MFNFICCFLPLFSDYTLTIYYSLFFSIFLLFYTIKIRIIFLSDSNFFFSYNSILVDKRGYLQLLLFKRIWDCDFHRWMLQQQMIRLVVLTYPTTLLSRFSVSCLLNPSNDSLAFKNHGLVYSKTLILWICSVPIFSKPNMMMRTMKKLVSS